MKKVLVVLCLLFTAILWSDELPKIQYENLKFGERETLEIMTWNIQNFPKSEHTVEYVTKIIRAIDPDVIGLQEIESDSAFSVLLNDLQKMDAVSNWNGYRADTNEWELNLAYLYKDSVINADSIYQIYPSDEKYHQPFPRKPLLMEFTYSDAKYYLINNHLKAMPGAKNIKRRRAASKLLDEYIDSNLPKENVIIIGDLNDQLTDIENENSFNVFLEQNSEYKFTDMHIAADSTANWSYPYWKYRGHIDHILVSNELFDELENASVKTIVIDEFMDGGEDSRYKYITDHRPVSIKFDFMKQN